MFEATHEMSAALYGTGLKCEGVNLLIVDGAAAGQEVAHVDLHIFPRFRGDVFGPRLPPGSGTRPERVELDRMAARAAA